MQRSPNADEKLHWDDVRLFLALCRSRKLGGAARTLGVDASTVSRRLDALERALAATLFDRGRDGVAPTEAAERLLPAAEEIEERMARFASEADALERTVSGLVRIACPADAAEVAIAPLVPELRARHPALRLEIDPGEAVADLTRREADLALRVVRPTHGELIVTRLGAVRWVLAAAPEVAKGLGALRSWTDAPWVGWGDRLSHVPPARWLAEHAPAVEPVVRSVSLRLQVALVANGAGVALLPERTARFYGLARVRTRPALQPAADAWPADDLFLVTHRALRDVPRIRAVWELFVERLGERPERRGRS